LNKELQTWLDNHKQEILPDFEGTPSELLDEILTLDEAKREIIFKDIEKFKTIEMPWVGFPDDAEKEIKKIIISQKPKDKLIMQPDKNGELHIKIRGALHEETLYGKSQGIETMRIPLSKLADKKFATEKTIEKIVNNYLKNAIKEHLKEFDNKKEEAFSAEGILALNTKLTEKTRNREWKRQGKKKKIGEKSSHTPISSIKVFYRDPAKIKQKKGQEKIEDVLQKLDRKKAFNKNLYVATGGNYLFAVVEKDGKRNFGLISFFDAVNLLKDEFKNAVDKHVFNKDMVFKKYFEEDNGTTKGSRLLFTLKQGDPVYMPIEEEVITDPQSPLYEDFWNDRMERNKNVYYVTKFSGKQVYFIKHNIANPIINKQEFGSQNAYEKINDLSIKEHCIKLNIDRLGNIKPSQS
jgi:hypothetical protein